MIQRTEASANYELHYVGDKLLYGIERENASFSWVRICRW